MKKIKLKCDFVARDEFICSLAEGKSVLHIGCTDAPYFEQAHKNNRLLHTKLSKFAVKLKGTDISLEGIEYLKLIDPNLDLELLDIMDSDKRNAYSGMYDLVILSDVLEHLPNPGIALSNIFMLMSKNAKLVITVPNALALKSFLRALAGFELVHQDHLCYYSFATLSKILSIQSMYSESSFSYVGGGNSYFAKVLKPVFKFLPWMADGIGIVASKNDVRLT